MSTKQPKSGGADGSTERLDCLETRLETLEQETTELREENATLREENESLRQQLEELDTTVTDIDALTDAIANGRKYNQDRIKALAEKLNDIEKQVQNLDNELIVEEPQQELTWMERFHHFGEDGVDDAPRVRDRHAHTLLRSIPDWGIRVEAGIVLKTKNSLRAKMERSLCRSTFEYSELYRACAALEERTDGQIQYIRDHPKRGKHLFIPEEAAKDLQFDFSAVSNWKQGMWVW